MGRAAELAMLDDARAKPRRCRDAATHPVRRASARRRSSRPSRRAAGAARWVLTGAAIRTRRSVSGGSAGDRRARRHLGQRRRRCRGQLMPDDIASARHRPSDPRPRARVRVYCHHRGGAASIRRRGVRPRCAACSPASRHRVRWCCGSTMRSRGDLDSAALIGELLRALDAPRILFRTLVPRQAGAPQGRCWRRSAAPVPRPEPRLDSACTRSGRCRSRGDRRARALRPRRRFVGAASLADGRGGGPMFALELRASSPSRARRARSAHAAATDTSRSVITARVTVCPRRRTPQRRGRRRTLDRGVARVALSGDDDLRPTLALLHAPSRAPVPSDGARRGRDRARSDPRGRLDRLPGSGAARCTSVQARWGAGRDVGRVVLVITSRRSPERPSARAGVRRRAATGPRVPARRPVSTRAEPSRSARLQHAGVDCSRAHRTHADVRRPRPTPRGTLESATAALEIERRRIPRQDAASRRRAVHAGDRFTTRGAGLPATLDVRRARSAARRQAITVPWACAARCSRPEARRTRTGSLAQPPKGATEQGKARLEALGGRRSSASTSSAGPISSSATRCSHGTRAIPHHH